MQERGINSTFKKIIYQSSEMVFLADDTYPYNIFYANEAFEAQIGSVLKERSLAGLGLDINAYIFKEELILTYEGTDYEFKLELPEDSASNYFLFYKGIELKKNGQLSPIDTQLVFKSNLDIIGIGQHDYLTYLNDAVLPILGYHSEELQNTSLCDFIHQKDLKKLKKSLKKGRQEDIAVLSRFRFKTKENRWAYLECTFQFTGDSFFVIGRDVTVQEKEKSKQSQLEKLRKETVDFSTVFSWEFDTYKKKLLIEPVGATILQTSECIQLENLENENDRIVFQAISNSISDFSAKENNKFQFQISDENGKLRSFSGLIEKAKANENYFLGVGWDDSFEEKAKSQNLLFEELIKNSPNAIIFVKPGGEILISSNEAKNLFGFDKDSELVHLSQLEMLFVEVDLWKEWVNISQKEEFIQRFSTLLISQTGKQLTLEISSKVNQIGEEKYISISFNNISEKVSLERSLEANSDFLMNLTEQVPGGLYQMVLDLEGKMSFSFLSKGIGAVLGLSEKELASFTDISGAISRVHPMDLPNVIMSSVASAKKQEPWQCQFRVKTNPNSSDYRWILGAARPQLLENGNMVWYGYLTDISSQKEFELKLDEARLAAEKANQIKSDFLSMISHELRTPLNAISGSTYSLLQEDPNNSQKSALNTINFAVDNLIIMINDLLDFQKIEAGKLTIENNPFNLEDFLYQIERGLSFHAKDSKNKLTFDLSKGLGINVKGDKTRLSQVMNNLITNALKFTNEGDVDVKVELKEEIGDKVRVYFEVKDNGIGIALENQEKIFNDFDQVKPTFSTKYGGTGLGLSITRKLLNLMGGEIKLESEENRGSKFFFELVFEIEDQNNRHLDSNHSTSATPSTLHLLMAEDNDVNALVLGKIIKKWGFTFDRVYNGKEAIEKFAKEHYDCVLMDIQMPVMDGFDATIGIKKIADVPVIALTAAAKLEIMERIDECGFDGFVAKPIDAAELLKKIREVISVRGQRS
jgi:PAS domain S-box-containing protein